MHVLGGKALRILFFKQRIQVVVSVSVMFVFAINQTKVLHLQHRIDFGHVVCVYAFPDHVTDDKQFAIRVVDQVFNVLRFEFVQQRHGYRTVGQHRKIGYRPRSTVSSAQCYVVTLFYSAMFV